MQFQKGLIPRQKVLFGAVKQHEEFENSKIIIINSQGVNTIRNLPRALKREREKKLPVEIGFGCSSHFEQDLREAQTTEGLRKKDWLISKGGSIVTPGRNR